MDNFTCTTMYCNVTSISTHDNNNINNKLYGGGAILERTTVALAQIRLRFNQP